MSAADRLSAETLRRGLRPGAVIGREIIVRAETTSTNDDVWELAQKDAPEGLVVFAESQSGARGQQGHRWESASHLGLWFSILLRPKIELKDSARIATWAAGVIAETIGQELSLEARVKPPNDVYLRDRKVAGVLVEMRAQIQAAHLAILGIGVNVNHSAEDFSNEISARAVSLAIMNNSPVGRTRLAIALLGNLDESYTANFRR